MSDPCGDTREGMKVEEAASSSIAASSFAGAVVGVGAGTVLAGARWYTFTCTTPPAWTTKLGMVQIWCGRGMREVSLPFLL